jgi:hypothetical protein
MKNILGILLVSLFVNMSYAQECDSLTYICYEYLKVDMKNDKPFISDGQVYQAFVDVEQSAEFKVTLFGGSFYRIATTAGKRDNYVIFSVYDMDRNLLFTNEDFNNKPYWDFKIENTIDCFVEARIDIDKKVSGCLVVLLGFQR